MLAWWLVRPHFACTLLQPIVWTALGRTRRMKDEDEDDDQDE